MVLLPSVTSEFDVPVIAAGGFLDGPTMAAALALGAEGVQLGTVMVTTVESPIHPNWKQAVIDAAETDTVFLNSHASPALRALRTGRTSALEFDHERNAMGSFGNVRDLYFGGDLEAGIALSGQVAGRITASRPVADVIRDCADGCEATLATPGHPVRWGMTVTEFLDEANVDLAAMQQVLDTAQHASTWRTGPSRPADGSGASSAGSPSLVAVGLVGAAAVYAVKALLDRRASPAPDGVAGRPRPERVHRIRHRRHRSALADHRRTTSGLRGPPGSATRVCDAGRRAAVGPGQRWWQTFAFRPLPHGHGSLRPAAAKTSRISSA